MKIVKKVFISMVSAVMFMISLNVSAEEQNGTFRNEFNWELNDDILTLKGINEEWTLIIKDRCWNIEGKKIGNINWYNDEGDFFSDDLFTDENMPMTRKLHDEYELIRKYNINTSEFYYKPIGINGNVPEVTIGKNVKYIGKDSLIDFSYLKKVTVLSENVVLDDSKIGWKSSGYIISGVTIYGYYRSTAEAYAQENGFDFKAIGDISGNNRIDLYDAIGIAKYLAGKRTFADDEITIADYNADGKVDFYDAIKIAETMLKNRRS